MLEEKRRRIINRLKIVKLDIDDSSQKKDVLNSWKEFNLHQTFAPVKRVESKFEEQDGFIEKDLHFIILDGKIMIDFISSLQLPDSKPKLRLALNGAENLTINLVYEVAAYSRENRTQRLLQYGYIPIIKENETNEIIFQKLILAGTKELMNYLWTATYIFSQLHITTCIFIYQS